MNSAVQLIIFAALGVIVVHLFIRFLKSIPETERKYVAEKITKRTETGELLLSFRDEKYSKRARRAELFIHLVISSLPFSYFAEVGTITVSREDLYMILFFLTTVNLIFFVVLRITHQVRLIEVFSAGIKIVHGPSRLLSAELHKYSTNRFYHFSKNDFSEQDEPGVLKINFFEDEVVIDSPEVIETIIKAYENFRAEEE